MKTHPTNTSGDAIANETLDFEDWQQLLTDEVASNADARQASLPPRNPPCGSTAAPSIHELFVDPNLLTEGDFATYHAPSELPPLSWVDQTRMGNDSYVSMMLQAPPPTPQPSHEQPRRINAAAAPRRSARIAAAPRVKEQDAEESQSSSMSVTDHTSDDDSEAEDKQSGQPVDKKERRRAQVRQASSRRRAKLKAEVAFIESRSKEQQEHMDVLDRMFPLP